MKKIYFVFAVPLLLAVSCSNESTQEKTARLCTDLATLNSAVENLRSLDPNSTVGDLRTAETK
jgi:outer membrane murein-binding lipoprotein Lpp